MTIDTNPPSVTSVSLSTDNALSATLYDNQTGTALPNALLAVLGDNITLKFETDERVLNPKVKLNGTEKIASRQIISGIADKTGRKWEAIYQVKSMTQVF